MSSIAIVGSGISGLVCAHLLHRDHEVVVFEAGGHIGGHTHTVPIETDSGSYHVDTGFVAYNETTYPNLVRLLRQLGVRTRPTEMSFSVSCDRTGLEYCGTSLNTLFAQRRNLLRPSFHRMVVDILRFNRNCQRSLDRGELIGTLGDFLERGRYSASFVRHYIVPMGAAIWSSSARRMLDFPVGFFVRFFKNHGLLGIRDHLPWRTVCGGSSRYIDPLVHGFRDRILLRTPVRQIRRREHQVDLVLANGQQRRFDEVIIATHGDQALRLLADATPAEREVLGAFDYQRNEAALHTDVSLLPRRALAWASWNYHVPPDDGAPVTVTYNMNRLQGLIAPHTFCVTLNRTADIDPRRLVKLIDFSHPVYNEASAVAQQRHAEISGVGRTHFCGAYWGHGFHEDGVNSALTVCRAFGKDPGATGEAVWRRPAAFIAAS